MSEKVKEKKQKKSRSLLDNELDEFEVNLEESLQKKDTIDIDYPDYFEEEEHPGVCRRRLEREQKEKEKEEELKRQAKREEEEALKKQNERRGKKVFVQDIDKELEKERKEKEQETEVEQYIHDPFEDADESSDTQEQDTKKKKGFWLIILGAIAVAAGIVLMGTGLFPYGLAAVGIGCVLIGIGIMKRSASKTDNDDKKRRDNNKGGE